MKITKNKIVSIRLSKYIHEALEKKGLTPQRIIDDFIEKNFDIKINVEIEEKKDLKKAA